MTVNDESQEFATQSFRVYKFALELQLRVYRESLQLGFVVSHSARISSAASISFGCQH